MAIKKEYTVNAEFKQFGSIPFRRKTNVVFHNGPNQCQGTIVMLNPGSCSPHPKRKLTDSWIRYPAKSDPTIGIVANWVNEAYNKEISGFINIVNLSNVKNPNSKEVYASWNPNPINDIILDINENADQAKWIWVAFGKDEITIEIRNKVLDYLKINYSHKLVGGSVEFLHPRRLSVLSKKEDIVKEIKEILK